MRLVLFTALLLGLAGCSEGASNPPAATMTENAAEGPPPLPEDAETVEFERPEVTATPSEAADTENAANTEPSGQIYWGIAEGEAMPLLWEDLMPEGSEEELQRQYEEFYAMLEKRYAANTTTLADAADGFNGIAEGSDFDFMPQLGTFDVVEDLDGQLVRIPGYVVPFDFESTRNISEFLFVPYMGACIHTPPPPPNQLILVRADPSVRVADIWSPYWLEGTLSTETTENELGDTAYTLRLNELEPYMLR